MQMQRMLPARSGYICTRWRQRCKVLLFARSLSQSPANEEVSFTELAEKPSASTSEPLFGIAPRKLRNVEDEDFVSSSPRQQEPSAGPLSEQHNYFSQTWAEQKYGPHFGGSERLDEQLIPPGPSPLPQIPAQKSALNRVWLVAPEELQASSGETFTFASLKVLSSAVACKHKTHLYRHMPSEMLDWKSRRKKVLADLELCSTDIICLQELDLFSDIQSELSLKGYAGLYKVGSGASPSGCAIFWKQKRFRLLHEESLDFSFLGMRVNVAQLCVLQSIVPGTSNMGDTSSSGNPGHNQGKCLVVGNIDVLFNPKRGDIKLGQCRAFLKQAHKLSSSWPGAPLIIGGCFYATPQSAVYTYLAKSKLDVFGLERQYLSGQVLKPVNSAGNAGKSSGAISASNLTSVDLSTRLRKSLLAKFASKQETRAVDFANSAIEMLNDTSSSSVIDSENRHICKDKHAAAKEFVSKTIEILESSQPPLRHINRVDVSPGINSETLDSDAIAASVSTNSDIDTPSGSKMEPSLKGSGNGAPVGTMPPGGTEVEIKADLYTSADLSGQSITPEHGWDPEELKIATGFTDDTVVKHELKLFSVYPEVQGRAESRDAKGEPLVTMYHREFRGTVDYIWRSEGLKTVKVLDTFSLNEMTPRLPFMVSGSDHISLACEVAFSTGEV
eukprot:c18956_g1_i1 orf=80-2092(+)